MFMTFMLLQVAMNVALIVCLVRLLRERDATARAAREREERLEALAAELCALGHHVSRHEPRDAAPPTPPEIAPRPSRPEPRPEQAPSRRREDAGTADRFRGAAALLERGVAIEQVAAETALLAGELQVLRNLRRVPGRPENKRRTNGAAAATAPAVRRAAHRGAGQASA